MHILNTHAVRSFADAIVKLRPDLLAGAVTSCQIKVLLGEMLDVWPASIFEDVIGDEPKPQSNKAVVAVDLDADDLDASVAELDRLGEG